MDLSTSREHGTAGERTVVVASGDLDARSAPQLRGLLVDLVAAGWLDLVLDLRDVTSIDATGLGVLLGGVVRTEQHGGSLRLACSSSPVLRVLQVTGLTGLLPVHRSLADALCGAAALGRPRAPATAALRPAPPTPGPGARLAG